MMAIFILIPLRGAHSQMKIYTTAGERNVQPFHSDINKYRMEEGTYNQKYSHILLKKTVLTGTPLFLKILLARAWASRF